MADGGSTLGLVAILKGQLSSLDPAKDKDGKEVGKYAKFAWFGGAKQLKLDHEIAGRLKISKFYAFEVEMREFKGETTVGWSGRLIGEVDSSGNPIK